ncbi:MAG: TonB-dependent receptor [Nitrospirae bacterium]|nr:TonB-dependent receptor [Nitrospirota bacterium]
MRLKTYLILFISLILPVHVMAEEVGNTTEDIFAIFAEEELVMTASKYLQPVSQSPSTITVITAEEIRESGVTTIPDILRRVPGVEVMQASVAEYNVGIRGENKLNSNKLLVMIDGRTVQEDFENHTFWTAFPIVLEEIEQIELIRGPGSSIWGANAFNGVVNIITKKPEDSPVISVSAVGGSESMSMGSFVHASRAGRMDYKFSIGYQRADIFNGRDEAALMVSVPEHGLEVYRGNAALQYHLPGNRSISMSGGFSDTPRYDGPYFGDGWSDSVIDNNYVHFNYQGMQTVLRGYWNRNDVEMKYIEAAVNSPPLITDLHIKSDLYNLEWLYYFNMGQSHKLISGINYQYNDSGGSLLHPDEVRPLNMTGFFFQDAWNPLKRVEIIYGARSDYHTFTHWNLSPRLAFIYHPTLDQTFRLTYGLAYRAPTPMELFSINGGNRELANEKIITYEAGYSLFAFRRLKGEINLFYNQLSDLISEYIDYKNRYNTETYGGEINADLLLTSRIKTFLNYSYQRFNDITGDDPTADRSSAPTHKLNGGLNIGMARGLSTDLSFHYVSDVSYAASVTNRRQLPNDIGSYITVNLHISYRLWKDNLVMAISASNLFDDVHREHPLGDEIGRRFFVSLNFKS